MNWLLIFAITRLAIDVGSSATKYEVAEVEGETIQTVLIDREVPLAIDEDIKQSGTNIITDNARHKLTTLIETIKKEALEQGATEYGAVATAAFRTAKNAGTTLDKVAKETGITITIIPESNEAILDFKGASHQLNIPHSQLVVWDLGGGSMEMIARAPNDKTLMYLGDLGSVGFREEVVRKIKKQNAAVVLSPNPLTREQIDAAVALAAAEAKKVPPDLQVKIAARETKTVAIGGFAFLQLPEKKTPTYTLDEVKQALYSKANKTDKELGNAPYAGQAVTDLALTLGYMQTLNIPILQLKDISLTTGLLISPKQMQKLDGGPEDRS
jgi:exopolyphosphatase / guanosine-5'-triphosphate,3'-diphosphate pyrophosphatase